MFMLNGKSLALDTAFEHDGVSYPSNWLRLASTHERSAIGITEVSDPTPYDDRFFWSAGNPKDVDVVRAMLTNQVKHTAYAMLSPTDYKLVRKVETGEDVDQTTLDKRTAIRTAHTSNMALIAAATTTAELAAIQFSWPNESTP